MGTNRKTNGKINKLNCRTAPSDTTIVDLLAKWNIMPQMRRYDERKAQKKKDEKKTKKRKARPDETMTGPVLVYQKL